ncbi:hypothetical protein L873DRAFT_1801718 [Choiromyces venosus 120613-1]|uniref:Uncharacterized protein n=1 Tax=Choiromyces venosus 120613-1 TaxID=1336337 RepID=A0A3N4JWK3_9PEZI|nr:hypothetical protein L873DRAFT_1801718 [Choiromyces venosus 120613-1]
MHYSNLQKGQEIEPNPPGTNVKPRKKPKQRIQSTTKSPQHHYSTSIDPIIGGDASVGNSGHERCSVEVKLHITHQNI